MNNGTDSKYERERLAQSEPSATDDKDSSSHRASVAGDAVLVERLETEAKFFTVHMDDEWEEVAVLLREAAAALRRRA